MERGASLRPYVTLRTGGPADYLYCARSAEDLSAAFRGAYDQGAAVTILGQGSNVLPSDQGVEGIVIVNGADRLTVDANGHVEAETGCSLQNLFLKAAQYSLSGLEFAVGIPGTLGGALASNAGAYRSSISEHIVELEVCEGGEPKWVEPAWMGFSYRHSRLREPSQQPFVVTRVRFEFPKGGIGSIYQKAKEFQRQRISKQPPPASAGSFFKNINSHDLAQSLHNLPKSMKEAGVVPAGYLIEACGLKGYQHNGAMISAKHANFVVNTGAASASAIRNLAEIVRQKVQERFGVVIEEEVLYIGRWNQEAEHARD